MPRPDPGRTHGHAHPRRGRPPVRPHGQAQGRRDDHALRLPPHAGGLPAGRPHPGPARRRSRRLLAQRGHHPRPGRGRHGRPRTGPVHPPVRHGHAHRRTGPQGPRTERKAPPGVSFDLRPGEILGVAGLPDSGRVELLHNLFGGDSGTAGTVELLGEPYERRNPIASVERRLAFVPGERRAQGLLTTMSVGENVGALTTRAFSRLGLIRRRAFDTAAAEQARRLRVKTATMDQPITSLSGGNQQKAVLGRWLAINPGVLILDEPTRGVDIGAKAEIYAQLTELADKGLAILCSSSDLPELLTLTDRIAVMSEGRLVAVVDSADATEESVMTLATGAAPAAA
ncbi:ATP-binding cassette domain-containing protein [Streptomyces sp. CBG31]|uniref:ATP-binding cassette domain-containing protein n=1 Tax=Streptomyces sp. CBG31 TaxID=2762623 RepID=UPI0028F6FECB|nr:ATP-binding cassette domain-containing protein [Streptomyces sp. CBG31]